MVSSVSVPGKRSAAKAVASSESISTGNAALNAPGQIALVFQGGGALGAYQLGVYESLHNIGIEPDWIVGTSIGAINAAIIAGNPPAERLAQLHAFWETVKQKPALSDVWQMAATWMGMTNNDAMNMGIIAKGVDGFFKPNQAAFSGLRRNLGELNAAYYDTSPLRETLLQRVDFDLVNRAGSPRLSLGAVNVREGTMRYFDSRTDKIAVEHVMASGALPPAFAAVPVGGELYWDGGLYSNTPIETVMNDRPRRNTLIFAVNMWHQKGKAPMSLAEVMGRAKDIQFASRADSYVEEERKLHRLRHIINELGQKLPPDLRDEARTKELLAWGCSTTMHICRLSAPCLPNEDQSKDIDFSAEGIESRREAGLADMQRYLACQPWRHANVDSMEGVIMHNPEDCT